MRGALGGGGKSRKAAKARLDLPKKGGGPEKAGIGTPAAPRKRPAPKGSGALLAWPGTFARFASLREGGPGRPATLSAMAALVVALGYQGTRLLAQGGIGGPGPALMFISAFLLLGLVIWVWIKAGLHRRDVTFVLNAKGVAIEPSSAQKALDRKMRTLVRVSFVASWKGGQWAAWRPFVPWRDVRKVVCKDVDREILVMGGTWDIRLKCTPDTFQQAVEIVRARTAGTAPDLRQETKQP